MENVLGFIDNKIEVEIISGPCYPAIELTVHEFQPSNPESLALLHLRSVNGCQVRSRFSLPLGIRNAETKELREKCLRHIESIVDVEQYSKENFDYYTSIISYKCLQAINRYRISCPTSQQVRQRSSF